MNHPLRLMAAALAVVLGLVALTGCSSDRTAKDCRPYADRPLSLVIVTGNHEGNPAPVLTDRSRPLVTQALCSGALDIVSSAGEPTKLTDDQFRLEKFGGTSGGNDDVMRRNVNRVTTALQLPPTGDGTNFVKAVGVAAAALRGRPADAVSRPGWVVVSGPRSGSALSITRIVLGTSAGRPRSAAAATPTALTKLTPSPVGGS